MTSAEAEALGVSEGTVSSTKSLCGALGVTWRKSSHHAAEQRKLSAINETIGKYEKLWARCKGLQAAHRLEHDMDIQACTVLVHKKFRAELTRVISEMDYKAYKEALAEKARLLHRGQPGG